jgi:hypothetical protein
VHKKKNIHSVAVGIVWLILIVSGASLLIHFAWNLAIPEIFGVGKLDIKGALGIVGLVVAGSLIGRHALYPSRQGTGWHVSKAQKNNQK